MTIITPLIPQFPQDLIGGATQTVQNGIASVEQTVADLSNTGSRLTNDQKLTQIPSQQNNSVGNNNSTSQRSNPMSALTAEVPHNGVNANDAGQSSAGNEKTPFTPLLNPLNNYDQSTYSIRFSMVSATSGNEQEVVLAETGSTNLNIQSLKLSSQPANTPESRNTVIDTFEMRIFEPYGANLPDLMLVAAKKINTQNFMKGLWKITIKFQGYDVATGLPKTNIVDRDWTWTVALTELLSKVDASGSMHTMKFVPQGQTGNNDQFTVIDQAITFPRTPQMTVGEVLKKFIDQLNKSAEQKNHGDRVKYEIDQIPYTNPTGAIKAPFDHKIGPTSPMQESSTNPDQITAGGSITFMAFVNQIFAASPTAADMANAASRTPDNNEKLNLEVVSTFHIVDTKVTNTSYNPDVKDYNKIIKYTIRPYETVRLLTNTEQARNVSETEKNKKKAQFLIKGGFLKKVYDYVFTGTNTEVLKFDIELNFMWLMTMDNNFGDRTSHSNKVGHSINQNAVKVNQQPQNPNVAPVNGSGFNPSTATSTNPVTSISSTPTISSLVQQAKSIASVPNQGIGQATTLLKAASANTVKQVETQLTQALSPQTARRSTSDKASASKSNIIYADDLVISQSKQDVTPVTFIQSGNVSNRVDVTGSIEPESSRQRSAYGMLLSQLYSGGMAERNLISINLNVRGDPYWLGSDSADVTSPNQQSSSNYPKYRNGEITFILRFNLPQGFDENTGTVKLVPSEMYSGFYSLYRIEHTFQDGAFTQVLQATRIIGMDVNDLMLINNGK